MAKQELKRKETSVRDSGGQQGQQVEHTFTIDDSCLPSALELQAYKGINPELITFLLETSKKEQNHRHSIDTKKMKTIAFESKSIHRINILGMILAFLIMMGGMAFSVYLIYLDKIITGSVFGGSTILIAASMFINKGNNKKK